MKALTAQSKDGKYWIKMMFHYSPILVHKVRGLDERKYLPEQKFWVCKHSISNIQRLKNWGFELSEDLQKTYEKYCQNIDYDNIPGLKGKLYDFQRDGVKFLHQRDGNALIADEMGLGKTVQALAYLQFSKKRPVIICVPASLKYNWYEETRKWIPDSKSVILSGRKLESVKGCEIVILNYDIIDTWLDELKKLKADVLILDESHYIKNNKTKRTKAVKVLGKTIPHIIALTGTPIINRPIEVYNTLQLIQPGLMPSRWKFAQRYCDLKHNGFGWDFGGASNTDELHLRLTNTVMLRRKKKDVLKELPDKVHSYIPIELTNEKEYKEAAMDVAEYVASQAVSKFKDTQEQVNSQLQDFYNQQNITGQPLEISEEALERMRVEKRDKVSAAEQLVRFEILKQVAVRGKMRGVIEWINDFLITMPEQKLVVFTIHKFVVKQLMEEFGKIAVKVDGSATKENRHTAVTQFQDIKSGKRLFVGNIQAAGVGLTLTAASYVAFVELPWQPAAMVQAEDRCHRIGQKNSVNVYYLLAQNTIEQEIAELLDQKRQVIDKIIDGEEVEEVNLLKLLMERTTKI